MFKLRQVADNQLGERLARETVREAIGLHSKHAIDRESLETIAKAALAWEVSSGLSRKIAVSEGKFSEKLAAR
jgi:hypothetical protein